MGKKFLAIPALILCAILAFAACSAKIDPIADDASASNVSSNGGFLVETGDYVYFINGNEIYSEDNTSGKVEKGALVRVKKSELKKGAEATKELVVSKLVSTGDHSAGIAIIGGRIYYATPNSDKSKTGSVYSDQIKFASAKLDGTDVKEFATADGKDGNDAAYRFAEADGKAYVLFVTLEDVEEDGVINEKSYLNVVAADGSVKIKEEYSSYVFDKDFGGQYVYYTKTVHNDTLNADESFNEVYRLKIGATSAEKILYGAGSNRDAAYVGKGVQGVTFDLIAANGGNVYFSVTNVDTSVSTDVYYAFLGEQLDADAEKNFANATVLAHGEVEGVFTEDSIFLSPNKILYIDTTNGLCVYNYENKDEYMSNYGITVEFPEMAGAEGAYVKDGYIYYHVGSTYYRLACSAEGDHLIAADAEAQKLSTVYFSTDWYAPEVVDDGTDEYLIGTLTDTNYFDYVFAVKIEDEEVLDMDALSEDLDVKAFIEENMKDEEELKTILNNLKEIKYGDFLSQSGWSTIKYVWTMSVSKLGESAQSKVDEEIQNAYYPTTDSSSEEEGGCSSAMGIGSFAGLAIIAAAGLFIGRKNK